MGYDPDKHDRTSLRLSDYDYRQPGAYFVTICTKNRICTLGRVVEGEVQLAALGEIAKACWQAIPDHFTQVALDAFVVMPNHVHGIIGIIDGRDATCRVPTGKSARRVFGKPLAGSLSTIIRSYKSAVTRQINRVNHTPGESVWQSNFYDHIIRNRRSLQHIRRYIVENPAQWRQDSYCLA